MQFEINPARAQQQAEELRKKAGSIDYHLLHVSGIYVSLKLVGVPSIQNTVRRVRKQNAALAEESRNLKSMADLLSRIATRYVETDESVRNRRSVKGSVLDAIAYGKRHSASNDEMDDYIRDFERTHPDEARRLRELLASGNNNHLTEDDIRRIKYLAYTAEEPYRSIYLRMLGAYMIGNAGMNGGAYYWSGDRTINFTYPDDFANDPRGEYTTFFHESGHGIDDLANMTNEDGFDSVNFRGHSDGMNRDVTIREAIEYDVYYNENNPHSVASLANSIIGRGGSGSRGNVDNVIEAFRRGSSRGLNKEDLKLYNAVRNAHLRETGGGAAMESVTDIYGGISRNQLQTDGNGRHGYTHDDSYWNDQNNVPVELWAEYFSYNMAGDTDAINYLREYFPEASQILDQFADSLA